MRPWENILPGHMWPYVVVANSKLTNIITVNELITIKYSSFSNKQILSTKKDQIHKSCQI